MCVQGASYKLFSNTASRYAEVEVFVETLKSFQSVENCLYISV